MGIKTKVIDKIRLIWTMPFLERFLIKITEGKEFGSFVTKLPPNHYQYKEGTIRNIKRNGINYKLDLSDIVDWYIYFGFSELSRKKLYKQLRKGDVVFDVGANVGDVSLNFSKLVTEMGEVHSFEPDPINYKRFEDNLNKNKLNNIKPNNLGVGNLPGVFYIASVKEGNKGMNRIVDEKNSNTRKINVTTIDNYVKENNITKINLIKIDVEGFEHNVLLGAKESLIRFKPKFFIELDNTNLVEQNSSAKSLITLLEKNKYKIKHAETDEAITSKSNFENCHYDIIAIPIN